MSVPEGPRREIRQSMIRSCRDGVRRVALDNKERLPDAIKAAAAAAAKVSR